jgi:hypothetical protein
MNMTTQEFVDNLKSEQVAKLHDIAFGEIPSEIKAMSDDELLAELFA